MASELNLTCEDNMIMMARYPDKYFDLAIVDPPYGINISKDLHERGESCAKNGFRKYSLKEWDNSVPSEAYFNELRRVSKNQVIWGGNYFLEYLGSSRCFVIWDKGQRDFSFADAELAWTSFNSSVRVFDFSRAALLKESLNKFHPTMKPIQLYKWILKNYATEGNKILDTHLGSMSIAIACWDMGFDLTGCEIDKDYFDAGIKRVEQHKKQLTIF